MTRSSYNNDQGKWVTRPRAEIPAEERDVFRLAANGGKARKDASLHLMLTPPRPAADVSEGRVVYKLEGGTELEIYFKCSSREGNVVTVKPDQLLGFDYNSWGDLNGACG